MEGWADGACRSHQIIVVCNITSRIEVDRHKWKALNPAPLAILMRGPNVHGMSASLSKEQNSRLG